MILSYEFIENLIIINLLIGLRSRGGFNRNRDDFQSQRGGRFNTRNQRSRGFR